MAGHDPGGHRNTGPGRLYFQFRRLRHGTDRGSPAVPLLASDQGHGRPGPPVHDPGRIPLQTLRRPGRPESPGAHGPGLDRGPAPRFLRPHLPARNLAQKGIGRICGTGRSIHAPFGEDSQPQPSRRLPALVGGLGAVERLFPGPVRPGRSPGRGLRPPERTRTRRGQGLSGRILPVYHPGIRHYLRSRRHHHRTHAFGRPGRSSGRPAGRAPGVHGLQTGRGGDVPTGGGPATAGHGREPMAASLTLPR